MINTIRSEQRHHADFGWLDTHWHFSFNDYFDPRNVRWGALRVFNDDVVRGGGGFGEHPHQDMEIVTWVIDGALEHRDHLGHVAQLGAGEAQVMSAGTGIEHAEYNASQTKPVHFLQLWILPRRKGVPARWDQRGFDREARRDRLMPIVSGYVEGDPGKPAIPGTLTIDQDATVYVSSLGAGKRVVHRSAPGRKAYVFVIAGQASVNGIEVNAGDQARIGDEPTLTVDAKADTELMLLDLPA